MPVRNFFNGIISGTGLGIGLIGVFVTALFAQSITSFKSGDLISAAEINANFANLQSENARITGQLLAPVGSIVAWHKHMAGAPGIPDGWVECNGQTLSDANSPFDGEIIPNLNGDVSGADSPDMSAKERLFLRGGLTSGQGEQDAFQGHWHELIEANRQTIVHGYDGLENGSVRNSAAGDWHSTRFFNPIRAPSSDGSNGTPRTGNETRPKSMSVVWVMRVK